MKQRPGPCRTCSCHNEAQCSSEGMSSSVASANWPRQPSNRSKDRTVEMTGLNGGPRTSSRRGKAMMP
eukprot:3832884-Rhodomonas_salina.1